MADHHDLVAGLREGLDRILGRVQGSKPGPTLICVAGLHGNETAGIFSVRRVLESLLPRASELKGEWVALSGNLGALRNGRRYLIRDLNRSWTQDRLRAAMDRTHGLEGEDREQGELLEALDQALARARDDVFLLDLHTTSAPSVPFTAVMDTPSNRGFSFHLPVPMVLGFDHLVDGTFFEYLTRRRIPSLVFEGGQHADAAAVDASEAAIWLALEGAGLVLEENFPEVGEARDSLRAATRHLPRVLEIIYRHSLAPGDGFRMHPGFENFQSVSPGQVLGHDLGGEVQAPHGGLLFLPLYQAQGDDGFFLVRETDRSDQDRPETPIHEATLP